MGPLAGTECCRQARVPTSLRQSGVQLGDLAVVDREVRHPFEYMCDHSPDFGLAQRRSGATVDPRAEGQMPVRGSFGVEHRSISELLFVVPGRSHAGDDPVARSKPDAGDLCFTDDGPSKGG